jgi:hypothetical protein
MEPPVCDMSWQCDAGSEFDLILDSQGLRPHQSTTSCSRSIFVSCLGRYTCQQTIICQYTGSFMLQYLVWKQHRLNVKGINESPEEGSKSLYRNVVY